MFLLGILAIIQITLIPGGIALKLFKIKTSGVIMFFLYSVGLSLYINYLTVCLLTLLRIYTIQIIMPVILIELCIYIFLYRNTKFASLFNTTPAGIFSKVKIYYNNLSPINKTLFAAAVIVAAFFLALIPFSAGTSYYFNDAIDSYTRWPKEWAANHFPLSTGHYPQLFPANLSLIDIINGEGGLRFFTKLFMPVFFLSIILMFFDLALSRKAFVHLAGLLIYSLILLIMYGLLFILDVNADIPVSFYGFLTFYVYLKQQSKNFDRQSIILISLFAVSCTNTKLAGFYILFITGLWILYKFYSLRKTVPILTLFRTVLYIILIIAAGNFWYLIQPKDMAGGLDQSMWQLPTYYLRIINAVYILAYSAGLPFFIFLIITFVSSFKVTESKPVIYAIILPATIIWMFFFSNDLRNYSFVISYIAFCSAYGLKYIYSKLHIREIQAPAAAYKTSGKYWGPVIIILLIAAGILSGTDWTFNYLMKMSYTLSIYVFNRFRLVNTIEIGYYKYVEYFVSAIRLLCFAAVLIILISKLKIKMAYILGVLTLCIIAAGFSVLDNKTIWKRQTNDIELVKVRNLQALIYPELNSGKGINYIYTNSPLYMQLVPNANTTNTFIQDINSLLYARKYDKGANNYILLQRDRLAPADIEKAIRATNAQVTLDGVDFLLLKIIDGGK